MIRTPKSKPRRLARSAFVVAGILVCLVVVAMLTASVTRGLVNHQRQSELFHRKLQSMLLCESGLQRARSQLSRNPAYRGEQWTIPAASIGYRWPATVDILLQPASDSTDRWQIHVTARYPMDSIDQLVQTRDMLVPVTGEE